MKLLFGIVAIFITLTWAIWEFILKVWDGNVFALLPVVVLIFILWKTMKFIHWFITSDKAKNLRNSISNLIYLFQKTQAQDENKLKEFVRILALPPEEFKKNL